MGVVTVRESSAPIWAIGAVSVAACGFLFWLLYFREASPATEAFGFLPGMNAVMNAGSATCLVLGIRAIRRGERRVHSRFMAGAFAFSTVFLMGYIAHHALHGDTKFGGEGPIRVAYLSLLASHVLLSIPALPMVLTTFYLSLSGQFDRHRRLARITFPVWLYVSATGVLVFLMLRTFG